MSASERDLEDAAQIQFARAQKPNGRLKYIQHVPVRMYDMDRKLRRYSLYFCQYVKSRGFRPHGSHTQQ
jgi:hypothetical protein